MLNWLQVAFGEWESQCVLGVTVCYFSTTSDPTVYGGGPQYYPDMYVSGQSVGPTGYGPYESYDGIDASGNYTQSGTTRSAQSSISEPLPPPPCSPDSYGYCSTNTYDYGTAYCQTIHIVNGRQVYYQQPYTTHAVYVTFSSSGQQLGVATETISKGNNLCSPVATSWSPAEPQAQYGDPNLP